MYLNDLLCIDEQDYDSLYVDGCDGISLDKFVEIQVKSCINEIENGESGGGGSGSMDDGIWAMIIILFICICIACIGWVKYSLKHRKGRAHQSFDHELSKDIQQNIPSGGVTEVEKMRRESEEKMEELDDP